MSRGRRFHQHYHLPWKLLSVHARALECNGDINISYLPHNLLLDIESRLNIACFLIAQEKNSTLTLERLDNINLHYGETLRWVCLDDRTCVVVRGLASYVCKLLVLA